jgi:hypothetical protein
MIFVKELLVKKFLAVYLGSPSEMSKWKEMNEEKRKKLEASGIEAWGKWVTTNKKAIVDQGSPLGKTKRITAQGISDTKNEMGAYTVVEAESQEAAAKIFEKHPHFMIFPGHSVEVMECLPMPGM